MVREMVRYIIGWADVAGASITTGVLHFQYVEVARMRLLKVDRHEYPGFL
jgi:hypothetical protein